MRRALAIVWLALALAPAASQPQSVRIGDRCMLASTPDSVDAIMTLKVTPFDARQRVPSDYLAIVGDEIARRVQLATPLQFGAFTTTRRDSNRVYPSEELMASLTLERSGVLRSASVVTRSMSEAFDTLVLGALKRAGADTAFPPIPERLRGDSVSFRLIASVGERLDTGEVLVARLRIPVYPVTRRPVPLPPGPRIKYPDALRRSGVQGEVVLAFVVGADSAIVPGTIRVLRYTDIRFWDEIRKVLLDGRIAPMLVGDCAVATRVVQPINFSFR